MQEQAAKKPILITMQQGIRDGELVQVQAYVDTKEEMADMVKAISTATKVRKDEFEQELEAVHAKALAEKARLDEQQTKGKGAK